MAAKVQYYDTDENGNLVETDAPEPTKTEKYIDDQVMQNSYTGPDTSTADVSASGTAASSLDNSDYSSYINDIYDAQIAGQIAQIENEYSNNTASLDRAEEKIDPYYYAARNATAADTAQSQQAWNEMAAATGLNAGTSGQAYLARQNSYQNAMTDINNSESEARANLDLQRQQLANDYSAAIQEAQANSDYERAQALLDDYYYQDQKATTAAENAKTEYANTIGAYAENYQAEINRINAAVASGDNSEAWKLPYLQAARNEKISAQQTAQAEAEQQAFDNWLKEQQLAVSWTNANKSSGSGSSSNSVTYSSLDSDLSDMLNNYGDSVSAQQKTGDYSYSTGVIANQMLSYIMQNAPDEATAYRLISKYGLDGYVDAYILGQEAQNATTGGAQQYYFRALDQ